MATPARYLAWTTRSRRSSTSADDVALREQLQAATQGRLPGLFGVELVTVEPGSVEARVEIQPQFLAPNGYLHAGTIVTLADTACGLGCRTSLPEGAEGFTTVELKANFLRSAGAGDALRCRARMAHGGRTTQVWDAHVTRESDGRDLALFRCTQYLLETAR